MGNAPFRLAELVGGLALASDLANAFPPEKVLRTVILAVEVGRRAGYDDATLRDAYYVSILRFLGCTGFAHEEAHIYGAGDDSVTRNVMAMADAADPVGTLRAIATGLGRGSSPAARVRAVAHMLLDREVVAKHARAQCDVSLRIAELLGMGDAVRSSLAQVCERFDGKGAPSCISGEGIGPSARLLHVADIAEIAHHRFGEEGARLEIQKRAGRHLDPRLADVFLRHGRELFDALEGASVWERFLAAEAEPVVMADEARADDVAAAFAHFVDLKSVHTLGHSLGVADLAAQGARAAGMPEQAVRELRRAALLHDLGRISVPNGIWDKAGRLGVAEWERVRLHAYYTERIVLRAPAWRPLARIASAAHERLDASGYHRGVPSALLQRPERFLAAADVLHALGEPRPHRPALPLDRAMATLREEAEAGRLDRDAVEAILAGTGSRAPRAPRVWPRGLSDREVEVLRLVARGKSNREIGDLLGISPRTVQNHVAHIYDKIGVYSRAGAALFVTEQALLD
jgi:HD-GYP domain-containing protein (c-di-GMP phosphodiesterase class II)/DNA-binding CsgD family transcriptional regulator